MKLVVNSQGGDTKSAIGIANYIKLNSMPVYVDGLCLSACAHFIMPATTELHVKDGSLVGWHHTATALFNILSKSGDNKGALDYLDVMRAELRFVQKMGISNRFLVEPMLETEAVCVIRNSNELASSKFSGIMTRHNFFVFSEKRFQELTGRNVQGHWALTSREIQLAKAREVPKTVQLDFVSNNETGEDARGVRALDDC